MRQIKEHNNSARSSLATLETKTTMSKRINLDQTPISHPDMFDRVDPDDVKPGDIFQGTRNSSKWYKNENKEDAEDWREYFRRKPADLDSAAARPGGDDGAVIMMTWIFTRDGVKKLASQVQGITKGD
jgi:hypothetical protein